MSTKYIIDNSDLTLTEQSINGNLLVTSDISGTTFYGDGSNLTGISPSVDYANVIFVDSTNGNDSTGEINNFIKPVQSINQALILASSLTLDPNNRALIYVRRGFNFVNNQFSPTTLITYTDFYCEPGATIYGGPGRISDQFSVGPVDVKFMGHATLYECDFFISKSSKIDIEVDTVNNTAPIMLVIPSSGTANVTYKAINAYSRCAGTAYGITIRNSANVTFNIQEKYESEYSNFDIRNHSGKIIINCPQTIIGSGTTYGYGGNFKQAVIVRASAGGRIVINGDLIANNVAGYYGGASGVISRVQDSWETLILNGSIYAENQFGLYGLGTSPASRTIINGDVDTNNLVAFITNSSSAVFRNGTLINRNTTSSSELYPILSVGGSGVYYVENCNMYSQGVSGSTGSTISAFWKDTTTSEINVYNTVYSAADTYGFFIRNSAGGAPVNNVRIHNCRSTKPLDTNITDILSPTGFILDTNISAINFI
jgi:hypothetical protein